MFSPRQFIMSNFFTHAYLMDLKGVRSSTILYSLPYCVCNKKVALTRTRLGKIVQNANIVLTKLMMAVYTIRILHKFKTSVLTTTQMLLFAGWSTLIGCTYIHKLDLFQKQEEIVLLLNRMHFFEKQQIAQGKNCFLTIQAFKQVRKF